MNIKIPVTIDQKPEATISELTEKSIVLNFLHRKFGWTELTQVCQGEVTIEELGHTSHGFFLTRSKRPATARDLFVDKLLSAIKNDKYTDETFFASLEKDIKTQTFHPGT
jgi:hypothetical protein